MPALLNQHGRPYRLELLRERGAEAAQNRRQIRARYDAVQTLAENVRHWSAVDYLSADAANSAAVRKTFRARSRYEFLNNSYCRGMVETLASDVIGTGPHLQLHTGDADLDAMIERRFGRWARAVDLARKLRAMRRAKCVDGEAFALFTSHARAQTPVTLNLRVIEADRVTTPDLGFDAENAIDGLRFDADGEPIEYHVLRQHPGGAGIFGAEKYDAYGANEVIHLFRVDRPEQHRGVPETGPALPLFAILRRYTLASLVAAETAADIAAVIETQQPDIAEFGPSGTTTQDPTSYETFDVFDLERGLVTVLPEGAKLSQLRAEHPQTTYSEFKREILAEAFAAVVMPFNVGAHDSSRFNYASGKLDRLTYGRVIRVEQSEWEDRCLLPTFVSWWREARLAFPEWRAINTDQLWDWSIGWRWDEIEDIDPAKAAGARRTNLEIGATTYPIEYARRGLDWETEMNKQAEALGLTTDEYKRRLADKLLATKTPAGA